MSDRRKAEVLLLEDELLVNMSTAQIIEDMGYRVRSFMRLDECAEAVRDKLPDLAVLDVNIFNQTSYSLAEWLKDRKVPVILLTGYNSPAIIEKWRTHPKCDKPCDVQYLGTLIEKA